MVDLSPGEVAQELGSFLRPCHSDFDCEWLTMMASIVCMCNLRSDKAAQMAANPMLILMSL